MPKAFSRDKKNQWKSQRKGYKRYQVDGRYYIDGGFTDNLPVIYPNETIRIQPFFTADPVEIMINEKYTLKSTLQGIVTYLD